MHANIYVQFSILSHNFHLSLSDLLFKSSSKHDYAAEQQSLWEDHHEKLFLCLELQQITNVMRGKFFIISRTIPAY